MMMRPLTHAVPIAVGLSRQTMLTVPPNLPFNKESSNDYPDPNSLQSEKQAHANICSRTRLLQLGPPETLDPHQQGNNPSHVR